MDISKFNQWLGGLLRSTIQPQNIIDHLNGCYFANHISTASYCFRHYRGRPIGHRRVLSFTGCLLGLILSLTACHKDEVVEKRPMLGSCQPVSPKGHLSYTSSSGSYTFQTNGGGTIVIDFKSFITITHADYPGFKIELWGGTYVNGEPKTSANHENLNGKHIKDRIGGRRTISFPDGAKLTLVADGEDGPLRSVSIYDGAESHHINPTCNALELSSTTLAIAQQLDQAEADGETGGFEFTSSGLLFVNLYTEDVAGNKVVNRYLLGEIIRNSPGQVRDHYDDPRLGHT
jgi:hypothetical protein